MQLRRVDVCVVGAGPAGAAAALHLRRRAPELRVLLIDRAGFPRDKICGDAISPDGVAELRRMGALSVLDGYAPVRTVRVRSVGGKEVVGDPPVEGYVVPRLVFDGRLVEHAVAAGAEIEQDVVRLLRPAHDGTVVNDAVTADVVIGADGANSTIRRLLGVRKNAAKRTLIALRGYAPSTPYPGELFLGWAPVRGTAYAWSFPVHERLANVGFGLPAPSLRGGRAELERRLGDGLGGIACLSGTLKAHPLPVSTDRPVPYRGRVLLAGDAASLINPLTGEGIFYALLSGRLAATAVLECPHAPGPRYAALIRRELGRHLRHTGWLAAAGRWRDASDVVVTAARDPRLLDDLAGLAFGKGAMSMRLGLGIARALLRRGSPEAA